MNPRFSPCSRRIPGFSLSFTIPPCAVELELIERENRRLLGALRLAKDKGGSVDSHPKPDSFHHKSLNEGKRKEEMRLINDSNKVSI